MTEFQTNMTGFYFAELFFCHMRFSSLDQELVPLFMAKSNKEEDDSVSGLMRFLIAHFAPVYGKLMPEGHWTTMFVVSDMCFYL